MTSGRIMQFSAAPLDLLLFVLVSVRRQKARQQGEKKKSEESQIKVNAQEDGSNFTTFIFAEKICKFTN